MTKTKKSSYSVKTGFGQVDVEPLLPHYNTLIEMAQTFRSSNFDKKSEVLFEKLGNLINISCEDLVYPEYVNRAKSAVDTIVEALTDILTTPMAPNCKAIQKAFMEDCTIHNCPETKHQNHISSAQFKLHPHFPTLVSAGMIPKGNLVLQGEETADWTGGLFLLLKNTVKAFPSGRVEIYRLPLMYFVDTEFQLAFGFNGQVVIKFLKVSPD